jgi:hypothetical protein
MGAIGVQGARRSVVSALVVMAVVWFAAIELARGQEPKGERPVSDARSPAGARKAWEYKQTWPCRGRDGSGDRDLAELNELGKQGWELVSYAPVAVSRECYVAILKREVPR